MSATAHTGPYPQIVGTVTRMPKRVRPPKHARIRVKLDTVMGVAREMGRLIRLSYNGHLPAEELTRYIFALDKLRACLESAVAIEADAIANAPAVPSTVHISIGTVPSGSYFTKEAAEQLHNGTLLLENENAVSVEDYTRAVSSRRADDELNAAIDAAAPGQLHEPIEADVADNNGFRRQSTVLAEPAPSPMVR